MGKRALSYLSVIFAIFKRDLLRIIANPVALVLIIGACALPSAYAWYCTATNWDPYQNTQGIRIAVSNEDAGATTPETGQINVGAKVIEKLKDNHELGWSFYDTSEEALQSVYSGESYAAIIIPKDFSADFTSILSGDFHEPQIDYYLNEKISASAPDFTNEGAQVIQDDVNENFVNTVSQTVFDITQKYGRLAEEKADDAEGKLASGVAGASAAIADAKNALASTKPALENMIDAAGKADGTLGDLKASLPTMKDTLDQARTTLEQARASSNEYCNELQDALDQSAIDIGKAASEASTSLATAQANLTKIHGQTSTALLRARQITAQNDSLIEEFSHMTADPALTEAINDLRADNERLGATIDALQKTNNALDDALQSITSAIQTMNDTAASGASDLAGTAAKIRTEVTPAINSSLDHYADALGTLSGLTIALEANIDQARSSLQGLSTSLSQSRNAANDAETSLSAIQTRLENTLTDLKGLSSGARVQALNEYLKIDPADAASFISAPVKLETNNVYPVKNYGSGVVAFFTSVALWVAGFVFIDLLKLRVRKDDLPPFTERQAYFGRWLLFMFLGIFPPLIVCAGDLIMGIQCIDPVAFIFAGLVSGLVYVNLIYAFAAAFRYIGKALAVLFLIVQIPGSSGLYPIEMMPAFYQAIHPLLPFTYTIDAFREAIGGFYGANYWIDLTILVLVFVPIGLFVGLVLGKWASNLTLLLDREIGRTGLFDGEQAPQDLKLRLSTLLKALLRSPEYRADLSRRVKSFEVRFPKLRMIGWFALAAQFLITFIVMIVVQADVNTKLILLMAMVIGIVAVDTYLIVIAYMKTSLASQLSLVDLTEEELTQRARARVKTRGAGASLRGVANAGNTDPDESTSGTDLAKSTLEGTLSEESDERRNRP